MENYYQCLITFLFSYCAIINLWFSKSIIIRNIKIINIYLPFHCYLSWHVENRKLCVHHLQWKQHSVVPSTKTLLNDYTYSLKRSLKSLVSVEKYFQDSQSEKIFAKHLIDYFLNELHTIELKVTWENHDTKELCNIPV